jgi:DnaJ-class molecular chaperone
MPVAKSAPQFRNFVRELERIRRIADSAVASLSGGRGTPVLPGTTSEAYEVLGVNAEVSDGVLKKVVDGLRMTWHPDHARDEADRRLREARMQQINIAWEMISATREAVA